eukprot:TRINITY_DN2712_c0_g1_i1.p1 TRINITY_DN2712_c0_g1~~TRINITY_DN2712_c0_g1_i1.p1  ORF type:complete len:1021 (-),score=266.12 TRINITY_DN2712_c0_g1_i1:130-3192(-)
MEEQTKYILDPANFQVVFITGPSGSGKASQCERLVRDYHFTYASVGDLLQQEIKASTIDGEKIKSQVEKGALVPDNLVLATLQKFIREKKQTKYLFSGFPRTIEQAKMFEQEIKEIDLIINLQVDQKLILERIKNGEKYGEKAKIPEEQQIQNLSQFNQNLFELIDSYKILGKVQDVDASKSIEETYTTIQKIIKPNLIFFMGPPAVGKSTCAQELAKKIKYSYISLDAFKKQNKCKDETEMTDKLIKYLDSMPSKNAIIDGFFLNPKSVTVFLKNFTEPLYLFYLDSPKDEIYMNISKYYQTEKEKTQLKLDYENYVKTRKEIISIFEKKPYFKIIPAVDTIQNIVKKIMDIIKPLLLITFVHHNADLAEQYCEQLEKQRGFVYVDLDAFIDLELDRNTKLNKKYQAYLMQGQKPIDFQVELLAKIIFSNPLHKKFIVKNLNDQQECFDQVQSQLFNIDYLVNFVQPQQQFSYFHTMKPYLVFYKNGKYIEISENKLDILDSYITKKTKFGIIVGPSASGKTTLSKHVAQQFSFELIEWEATNTVIKEKYSTPEEPIEEVTYNLVEKYLVDKLDPNKATNTFILDGFPYSNEQLQTLLKKVGLPSFIINLKLDKEHLVKRYRLKEQQEVEGEVDEETSNKIDGFLAKANEGTQFFTDLSQKNFGVSLYNIDANISLDSTKKALNNIFFKRVYIVNDQVPLDTHDMLDHKLIFLNFCFAKKIIFVDIADLINKYKSKYQQIDSQFQMRWTKLDSLHPSIYSPDLVVKIIKEYLSTLAFEPRDILLFGYPASDTKLDEKSKKEKLFPRPSDEMLYIEKMIGSIRLSLLLTDVKQNYEMWDEIWDLVKPVEQPKKKKEDGQEGDQEENKEEQQPEGEENKPKFNIYEYQWSKNDGVPKSVGQWFNKQKKTIKKHYSLRNGPEQTYEKLSQYLTLINEENELNKEEQDYRRVNLFVQLRYDEFPPEEENEPEPIQLIEEVEQPQQQLVVENKEEVQPQEGQEKVENQQVEGQEEQQQQEEEQQ